MNCVLQDSFGVNRRELCVHNAFNVVREVGLFRRHGINGYYELTSPGLRGYDQGIRELLMPAGKHTSVRVALAVPPKLHEQLSEWADFEGRPLASLCMYLIENALRDAQTKGIAPKWSEGVPEIEVIEVAKNKRGTSEDTKTEKSRRSDKRDQILEALSALLDS